MLLMGAPHRGQSDSVFGRQTERAAPVGGDDLVAARKPAPLELVRYDPRLVRRQLGQRDGASPLGPYLEGRDAVMTEAGMTWALV